MPIDDVSADRAVTYQTCRVCLGCGDVSGVTCSTCEGTGAEPTHATLTALSECMEALERAEGELLLWQDYSATRDEQLRFVMSILDEAGDVLAEEAPGYTVLLARIDAAINNWPGKVD